MSLGEHKQIVRPCPKIRGWAKLLMRYPIYLSDSNISRNRYRIGCYYETKFGVSFVSCYVFKLCFYLPS